MKYHILQISLTDAEVDLINEKGHDAVARHARHLNQDILIHDYDHVADFEVGSLLEVITLGNEDIDRNNHPQINIVIDNPEQGLASISKGDIIIESKSKRVYYITGHNIKVLDVKPEELVGLIFDTKEVA
tara:strand:- start:152 stop:541 length:390 start_codon:yes stop_codon:yes gene_type:complete